MKRCLHALLCICGLLFSASAMAQLTADFTSNIVSGCAPLFVQFTDQSTGNPTSWSWNLGNSTSSTLQNPSTLYVTPGTYAVTLTVSNGSGSNTKTVTNYITVIPSPTSNFIASDSGFFCPPKTIQFTNLSVPNSTGTSSYLWDFGDGVTSNQVNPTHTYNSPGNYSVLLSITNGAGCPNIKSKTNYINIYNRPVANFTSTNNNSCSYPVSVNFNNTSSGATSYQWDFGDGGTSTQANPNHSYTIPGSYTISLIASNGSGCSDTMIKPVFVNIGILNPAFTKSASSVCTKTPITFTNTSTPGTGTSTWYFGDGGTATGTVTSHAYAAPGTYTVKLVVNYGGCKDSTSQTVTVNQGPLANFTSLTTLGCNVPYTSTFTNLTTGNASNYQWFFGDGGTSNAANPSHTYTAMGSYNVMLVAYGANGCNDTIVKTNYINIVPGTFVVTPANNTGCIPATFTFNITMNPFKAMSSYTWDFGDGTIITNNSSTATHTYTTQGTYTVSATGVTTTGCAYTTTTTANVKVGSLPIVNFTAPDSVCPSEQIYFTNTSNNGNPSAYNYTWKFGDGNTSTLTNPTHIYYSQGNYMVTLIAENNGCKDSITHQIVVNPPAAVFNVGYSCTNRKLVTFNNTSQGGSLYYWQFGDGDTSTLPNPPPHLYNSFGLYTVLLKVTHLPSMCISINTVPVLLFDLDAQFTASDTIICKNQFTTFTAQPSPYIADYIWDFGDGNTQITATNTVSHTYTVSGLFNVRLIVKDIRGCYDTLIRPNYIEVSGPISDFAGVPVTGCAPLNVNFTDQSAGGGYAITSRTWRFGDGGINTGNSTSVTHTYGPGVFSVSLIVTNSKGCTDSIQKTNYIASIKPTASFSATPTMICPADTVFFTNTSITNNPYPTTLTYFWDFGDGNTSTQTNPAHVYTTTGNYDVKLVVSDGQCTDTLIKTAYINVGGVNISFTASDTFSACPPLTVNFVNTSSNGYNFVWSFGNGNISFLNNATAFYPNPGVYTVRLSGQNGICYDTAYKTITVIAPSGNFSYSPLTGCAPLTVSFTSTNTNSPILTWDMNNGVTITTTTSSTSYTYTQPGKYVPKLLLGDGANCIIPIIGTDTIVVNTIDADFSFTPSTLCQSGTINFKDTTLTTTTPVTSRSWTFGDGGTSAAHNPSHTYNSPGTYTVTLIIGTGQGCNDTVIKTVTILAPPQVSAGNNVAICQGNTTPVQLQATGGTSYAWSPATGLSCTNCSNPTTNPTTTTIYTVVGTGTNGCTDTSQVTVTVNPLPNLQTGANPTICAGSSIQLAVTGAASYSWSPATGLSCTNCNNPTASPGSTTTYTITGTSGLNCSTTAQITVNVDTIPAVSATATSTTICSGDTTLLHAIGGTTYNWSPATGLSCTNCASPKATPTVTTTYTVIGMAGTGCSDTGSVTIVVNPLPVINVANQSICAGFSTVLSATGAVNYSWSPATGLSCTNCSNPTATPASTTIYTITGTSSLGCTNSTQATVTVNNPPIVTVTPNQTICIGSSIPLQASGASTYSWSQATGLSCTSCANPNASPTTTTTYTVIGTDVNGCRDTAQVKVNVNPLPVVDAGPDKSICKFNSVQLQANGGQSYSWTPSQGLSCSNCATPSASPTVSTTYYVTGTDANGCNNSDSVKVNLYPDAQITASSDTTICEGHQIQLTASGGISYNWTPSKGLSCTSCSNPVASPGTNTTYMVIGTDANGCMDSARVAISVILKEPFVFDSNDTLCEGESTQLFVSGGNVYIWSPAIGLNNPNISNPVAKPEKTTTYSVIIKQGNCFADTGIITIYVNPLPTVNAGPDQRIIAGASVNLFANGTHTDYYKWSPARDLTCDDCMNPVATPKETTTYKVLASNRWGCTAEDDVTIFISCDNSQVFVPNTFTPNGDGNNDRFYVQGRGLSIINRVRVYSRWGELMYEAQNIQPGEELVGWDGSYKGEPLKPDVYVYIIDATCYNGTPMQLKGDISLIR